jgi:hypothetical protein
MITFVKLNLNNEFLPERIIAKAAHPRLWTFLGEQTVFEVAVSPWRPSQTMEKPVSGEPHVSDDPKGSGGR